MSTGIQWTDEVWNCVVGCNQVSPGCDNCYAKALHDKRHRAVLAGKKLAPQYAQPFETVQLMPDRLKAPTHWAKPRRVFVNSVSDLFHADVPDVFLDSVFAVMAFCGRHTFQILTKRAGRMRSYIDGLADRGGSGRGFARLEGAARQLGLTLSFEGRPLVRWPIPNIWLGVSVENRAALSRVGALRETAAAVRFISFEPLLEEVTANLTGIQWAIIGGESGKNARPFDVGWARSLVRQCRAAGVAVFVKQIGALPVDNDCGDGERLPNHPKTQRVREAWHFGETDGNPHVLLLKGSHGSDPANWPQDIRIREFPA